MNRNKLANTQNPYQGSMKKVLTVCSAGLLRSPTIAWVLSNPPFNFNTRACGISKEYALIHVDEYLISWADEIVVVEDEHRCYVEGIIEDNNLNEKPIHLLTTPDMYSTRDPKLVEIITPKLKEIFLGEVNE